MRSGVNEEGKPSFPTRMKLQGPSGVSLLVHNHRQRHLRFKPILGLFRANEFCATTDSSWAFYSKIPYVHIKSPSLRYCCLYVSVGLRELMGFA
ncbi:hypothetical protein FOPG_18465 [Fusarium oxysporum f. sp. conglutinans race 2 54008]|uniref:Uncharacterized protein n=1 Tax=Fusarium oxysporum f. sp. conglutinans race 2 54008 TaxID=1089457 RepID=X0HVZ5_FUSOX|nr:hypothetical protein FOPG_18465 [Fusarium oxysporum f. sp. conglutinans race 2 54008]